MVHSHAQNLPSAADKAVEEAHEAPGQGAQPQAAFANYLRGLAQQAPAEIKAAPAAAKAPAEVKAAPAEVKAAPAEIKAAPAEIKAAPAEIKAAEQAPAPVEAPAPVVQAPEAIQALAAPEQAEAKPAPAPVVEAPEVKPAEVAEVAAALVPRSQAPEAQAALVEAEVAPAVVAPPTLTSSRFAGIAGFSAVLAGERFLKWGNCNGPITMALQGALSALGHACGPIDGVWGQKTNAGLLSFQRAAGLNADGVVGKLTLTELDHQDPGGSGPGDGQADPRLEHQIEKKDGQFVDPEAVGPLTRLPYEEFDAGSDWDGEKIAARWTQIDLDPTTSTDANRCAANAAMVPRIMMGVGALTKFNAALMDAAKTQIASPHLSLERKALVGAKLTALGLADAAIRLASGTYHSLDLIADAAKVIMTRDPTGPTSGNEGAVIHDEATSTSVIANQIPGSVADVDALCDVLKPGEAWLVQVDTDKKDPNTPNDVSQVDHFVTIGCAKDKRPDEGGIYLYDPWPRKGDQTIFRDRNKLDFMEYFTDGQGGMKYAEFLSRTTPQT